VTTTYDPKLRRLGYRVRVGPQSPLLAMLDRAECRMRPMNRLYPSSGHWIGRCPICGAEDRAYVEPGLTEWSTTCGCSPRPGGLLELHAALILQAVAA
jgi:hypothetical protein